MQGNKDIQQVTDGNAVIDLAIFTTVGDRSEQQDSFGYALKEHEGLIVVCDGMGGHEGGKLASSCAVDSFLTAYSENGMTDDAAAFLDRTTKQAGEKVCSCRGMSGEEINAGSTLVAVLIREGALYWSAVGDSRAYLVRSGEYAQITLDHNYQTVLKEQLSAGLIDQEEYGRQSDKAEALISYLGIPELRLIDYNREPLSLIKGDRLVIMTDGLYKAVTEEDIFRIIGNFNNIAEAVQALESKAQRCTKSTRNRDNMTVAIVSVR